MNLVRRELSRVLRTRHLKRVELAQEIGVSAPFLSAVLRGRKRPGPKVLRYLGLVAYEAYRFARATQPAN